MIAFHLPRPSSRRLRSAGCAACLVLLGGGAPPSVLAQESNGEARRADFLDASQGLSATYESVRTGAFQRAGGLLDRYRRLQSDLDLWVKSWDAIKGFAALPTEDLPTAEARLFKTIGDQSAGLLRIDQAQGDLSRDLVAAASTLEGARRVGYTLEGYDAGYRSLVAAADAFAKTLRDMDAHAAAMVRPVRGSVDGVHQVLRSRLKLAVVGKAQEEIDAARRAIDEVFTAEALLRPVEVEVERNMDGFQKAYANVVAYRIADSYALVTSACRQAQRTIATLPVAPALRDAGAARVQKVCDGATHLRDALFNRGTYGEVVARILEDRKARVGKACMVADWALRVDCEAYRWASRIPAEDVKGMDVRKLRNLERVWESIERGPTGGQNLELE